MSLLAPEFQKFFEAGIYVGPGKTLTNGWGEYFYREYKGGPELCTFRRGVDGPFLSQIMQLPKFADIEDPVKRLIAVGKSVIDGTEYTYGPDGRSVCTV